MLDSSYSDLAANQNPTDAGVQPRALAADAAAVVFDPPAQVLVVDDEPRNLDFMGEFLAAR